MVLPSVVVATLPPSLQSPDLRSEAKGVMGREITLSCVIAGEGKNAITYCMLAGGHHGGCRSVYGYT